jgi:hypothetical protein
MTARDNFSMTGHPPQKRMSGAILVLAAALLTGCSSIPSHSWVMYTTSTPRPPSLDTAALGREPVATLGLAAPAGLQGFGPTLSYALNDALLQMSPPMRAIPAYETLNRLNDQGLAMEYGDLVSGFARSGILERGRLRRIGEALGSPYVLQPGFAQLNEAVGDKFEVAGFKLVKTRLTTLRLWLQLWDTRRGQMLWESSGEVTVAAQLLKGPAAVPLEDIAQKLWSRIIQDGLLGKVGGPSSSRVEHGTPQDRR